MEEGPPERGFQEVRVPSKGRLLRAAVPPAPGLTGGPERLRPVCLGLTPRPTGGPQALAEPGSLCTNQASAVLAQRRPADKIRQHEAEQFEPRVDAAASPSRGSAASTGRSPPAGGAWQVPPAAHPPESKSQQPVTLAHVSPPPATSCQRSRKAYAAQHRSPRHAQGIKSPRVVDRESIGLIMDEVLQRHTKQILQAIDKHTSRILETSRASELFEDDSLEAYAAAFVDSSEESGATQRFKDQTLKIEVERLEEYEKEISADGSRSGNGLLWEVGSRGDMKRQPTDSSLGLLRQGEFIKACKKISRGTSHPWLVKIEEWLEWWEHLKNPHGTRRIDKFVQSTYFQLGCIVIILANTVFVAIDANRQMQHYVDNSTRTQQSKVEQYIFTSLYLLELSLRAYSERWFFFIGENMKWNWFDMVVVVSSVIGDFVLSGTNSLSFLRVARILKVVKVTRMLRLMRHIGLGELQRMVSQVFGSLRSLIWCFALLACITYVFAIFFVYSLCDLPSVDEGQHLDEVVNRFGSVSRTMLTLLEATTGGIDWGDIHDVLTEAGNWVAFCFILYVLFFVIAVWNIITATFVERMAKMARPDNDAVAMEERAKNFEVALDLRELLEGMDLDSSQTLSHEEMKACLSSPAFQDFLLAHGVHIYEASTFFEMLFECSGVDSLKIDTVVAYCMRIKGQATSLDLHTMRYEIANGLQQTQCMLKTLEGHMAQMPRLRRKPSAMCSHLNMNSRVDVMDPHN